MNLIEIFGFPSQFIQNIKVSSNSIQLFLYSHLISANIREYEPIFKKNINLLLEPVKNKVQNQMKYLEELEKNIIDTNSHIIEKYLFYYLFSLKIIKKKQNKIS